MPYHGPAFAAHSGHNISQDALDDFDAVISTLNFRDFERLAISKRLRRETISKDLEVRISKQSLIIGFNIYYEIRFGDGLRWYIRFPLDIRQQERGALRRMENEYRSMIYIKNVISSEFLEIGRTVPKVQFWGNSMEQAKYAFGFISRPRGSRVRDLWFNNQWSTKDRRLAILRSVAQSVAPLYTLNSPHIGLLEFDAGSNFRSIGPAWMNSTVSFGLSNGCRAPGPHESLDSQLKAMLHDRESSRHQDLEFKCESRFLRFLIESVPRHMYAAPLTLTYPIFNWESIFVDEDTCEVTGLLGWDGLRAESAPRGCARYPDWITHDWNLAIDPCVKVGSQILTETSEQLSSYRRHYASYWKEEARHLRLRDYDPRWTRHSHILEAIVSCFTEEVPLAQVFDQLLNHAYAGSKDQKHNFYSTNYLPEFLTKHRYLLKGMEHDMQKQLGCMWRAE